MRHKWRNSQRSVEFNISMFVKNIQINHNWANLSPIPPSHPYYNFRITMRNTYVGDLLLFLTRCLVMSTANENTYTRLTAYLLIVN